MSVPATKERVARLLDGLAECGIVNAVVMFEYDSGDGECPHIAKIGSPMACMALSEWASSFQHEEVYEGLEVSVWYDDDEEEDEV